MMNKYEVPAFLASALPEIKGMLTEKNASDLFDPILSVQLLTDVCVSSVHYRKSKTLKRCFLAAENLYFRGNQTIQTAVKTVFVQSFPAMFNACENSAQQSSLNALIPGYFSILYQNQLLLPQRSR